MRDDGIGLAALERLASAWEFPDDVELVDGGTWGLRLLPEIEDAERVLLIDAIDVGRPEGAVIVLERAEIPMFLSAKLSPHQVGVRDVLALAALRDRLPADTVAMGIQPARIELGTELSDEAEASLAALLERVVERLALWGRAPKAA
jgi:hydrogenase maturation protease